MRAPQKRDAHYLLPVKDGSLSHAQYICHSKYLESFIHGILAQFTAEKNAIDLGILPPPQTKDEEYLLRMTLTEKTMNAFRVTGLVLRALHHFTKAWRDPGTSHTGISATDQVPQKVFSTTCSSRGGCA